MTTLSVKSVILGDPASPRHQINPFELNLLLEQIQNLSALNSNLYFEDTLAGLIALGSVPDGSIGFVLDDAGNTGTWRREVGAWILTASLPAAFVDGTDSDISGFAVLRQSYLPGDTPQNFTQTLSGPVGSTLNPIGTVEDTAQGGAFYRLNGSKVLGVRERIRLIEGKRFELEWKIQRATDPADPVGDGIQLGIAWLDGTKNLITKEVLETVNLSVSDGPFTKSYFVLENASETDPIEVPIPSGAIYMVPYVETFGSDGVTDIYRLGWDRVTRVANSFYVATDGSDANSGTSLYEPLATIPAALQKMVESNQAGAIIVMPGEYLIPPDTEVPANCLLYGYDLRVTRLFLANADGTAKAVGSERNNNMFLMNSGIKVRGFTFSGLEHEEYTLDVLNELYSPPTKGYAFAFKPGAIITRSPYIADCSQLHDLTQEEMTLPIDKANGNPLMPRGGGNIIADGAALGPSSPLRSVVVDSFTAINPNGVGYLMLRSAFVQLVSVFTNWSRVGIWSHDGGQVTIANSNNTFGDYSFAATGFRNVVEVPDPTINYPVSIELADAVASQKQSIIDDVWVSLLAQGSQVQPSDEAITKRDLNTLLTQLEGDFRSGQTRGSQYFVKGFFGWNGQYLFNTAYLADFLLSYQLVSNRIQAISGIPAVQINFMQDMISLISENLSNPQLTFFPSVIEATGQQFSYAGSGVNYNSLPISQRSTGRAPDPGNTLIKSNGGRIYATFSTEVGDTYLGEDLRVDFERSTIEGQAFSRGVQNIALPLIVGVGG